MSVALSLSSELSKLNFRSKIVCGTHRKFATAENYSNSIVAIPVRSWIKKHPFSSMWSMKFGLNLYKEIKNSNIVHIHFARDLIPVVAAIICVIKRKKFVLQTHGMISKQETKIQLWFDILIVKHIMEKAEIVFVLSEIEDKDLSRLKITNTQLLTNGIAISGDRRFTRRNSTIKVIFISRIEKRKNLRCFIEVAQLSHMFQLNYSFEIYGPDEGDLTENLELIEKLGLTNIQYCGSVRFDKVPAKISEQDILILPSFAEPWAMVALEALSVGTRIIIFPSAGIAPRIKTIYPEFVTEAENAFSVFQSLVLMDGQTSDVMRSEIKKFCADHFSISKVVNDYLHILEVVPKVCFK